MEFYESVVTEEDFLQAVADGDGSELGGERCGICMDVIIDRGVLDCCQHWFCFACIDNWSTITNLCPLCQNEFQMITCVPVYDTIGCNKADEGSVSRNNDWSVEGKNNSLSFPSYYIDENAVTCLDGDGCKIRNGSLNLDGNSSLDTSIACDSCDIWFHAFCVGFDPEGTDVELWLCPRCLVDETQGSGVKSQGIVQHQNDLENCKDPPVDVFSGKVSVSVADDGETALVVSMVDQRQLLEEPTEGASSTMGFNTEVTLSSKPEEQAGEQIINSQPNTEPTTDAGICMPHTETTCIPSVFETSEVPSTEYHESESELKHDLFKMGPDQGSYVVCPSDDSAKGVQVVDLAENSSGDIPNVKKGFAATDHNRRKRKYIGGNVCTSDQKKPRRGKEAFSRKIKAEEDNQKTAVADEHPDHVSEKVPASDIMSIVQDPESSVVGRLLADNFSEGKRDISGLRVKKIVRRPVEDKESFLLVQKLQKEIREVVRNKSSEVVGNAIFDPKLLAAFRAAVIVPEAKPVKKVSSLLAKAKNVILQKGKTRENLTKKIYATSGGKRKHDWHRDCEVEFWKHRCINKVPKPEKIETLKSVLNLLKMGPDTAKWEQKSEEEARKSILSRLYLADASVFPRKDNVAPLSVLEGSSKQETVQESTSAEKETKLSFDNRLTPNQENNTVLSQRDNSSAIHRKNKNPPTVLNTRFSSSTAADSTENSQKTKIAKPDEGKIDKRKWALEVLARKTATNSARVNQKQEDDNPLKGNYPLLAQLPADMRPKLVLGRPSKIPISARQAQLYRLAEHLLKLTNVSPMHRTGATELAVADAVNIEMEVASKSNSKVVYSNLISLEIRHRTNTTSSHMVEECDPFNSLAVSHGEEDSSRPLSPSSLDPDVQKALKNAGLLFDTSPDSPNNSTENFNEDRGSFLVAKGEDEGPYNVLEMNPNSELDIYGDFDYDLDDEDYIGANAIKASNLEIQEAGRSKVKVVFSTRHTDRLNPALDFENHADIQNANDDKVDSSAVPPDSTDEGGHKELTLEECEELYGPEKQPLSVKYPTENTIPQNIEDEYAKAEHRSCNVDAQSGTCEKLNNSSNSSLKDENKQFSNHSADKEVRIGGSIVKKVEAYIKEHVRPLCKSGIIAVDQYRWAVSKTVEKVMKYHSKAKNANFLIKEGEKVKKLAEQYVEAVQKRQDNNNKK